MHGYGESHHLPRNQRANIAVRSKLALSLGLTVVFVVVEIVAGVLANSLALLTDAVHNLTDVLALGLSWFALWKQTRPSGAANTYGHHRIGILVALINSTTLVVVSLGVLYEAYRRLSSPQDVHAPTLIVVGLLAVVVNLVTALLIRRREETDLNLRAAFLHLIGDVASTTATFLAGVVIYFTGANWLDPLTSALIGVLILVGAWRILRQAVEILLESAPRDLDLSTMVEDMLEIDGVLNVHDLHVWSITTDLRAMSAHVLTDDVPISVGSRIRDDIVRLLSNRYKIAHAALQLECPGCEGGRLYCGLEGLDPSRMA